MIAIKKIRPDLGAHVLELVCDCTPEKVILLNLDTDSLVCNLNTGLVRCPRCGEQARREDVLWQGEKLAKISEEARQNWQTQNPDTGEAVHA